jgi:hypothetical protein
MVSLHNPTKKQDRGRMCRIKKEKREEKNRMAGWTG